MYFIFTRLCKTDRILLRLLSSTDVGADHKLSIIVMKPGIYSASNGKQALNSLRFNIGPTTCEHFRKDLLTSFKKQISEYTVIFIPLFSSLINKARGMEFLERKKR